MLRPTWMLMDSMWKKTYKYAQYKLKKLYQNMTTEKLRSAGFFEESSIFSHSQVFLVYSYATFTVAQPGNTRGKSVVICNSIFPFK